MDKKISRKILLLALNSIKNPLKIILIWSRKMWEENLLTVSSVNVTIKSFQKTVRSRFIFHHDNMDLEVLNLTIKKILNSILRRDRKKSDFRR